jgi:hypothetical protein
VAIHFLEAVAEMELPPTHKLVLMAFADAASAETRIAWPGLEKILAWSGLRKSRALAVVKELREAGHLHQIARAGNGRRAEFLVLPRHECAKHRPLHAGSSPADPVGSNLSDVGSNIECVGSAQTGPLPLVTPSGTPPAADPNAERVRVARIAANLPVNGWSDERQQKTVAAVLADVGGEAGDCDIVWDALAALAADPDANGPGLLKHRSAEVAARIRARRGRARAKQEAQQLRDLEAAKRAAASDPTPEWQAARTNLARRPATEPLAAQHAHAEQAHSDATSVVAA